MPRKLHVPRPALLVIRFTNRGRFNTAIDFYTEFLGEGPVESVTNEFASFRVGSARRPVKRDVEFRLELHPGDTSDLKGHTLLYWGIDPARVAETKRLAEKFTYRTEVTAGTNQLYADSFLVTDGFDNFFGGHPNPHFPPSIELAVSSPFGKILTVLAAGALLFGGLRLFRSQRQ